MSQAQLPPHFGFNLLLSCTGHELAQFFCCFRTIRMPSTVGHPDLKNAYFWFCWQY